MVHVNPVADLAQPPQEWARACYVFQAKARAMRASMMEAKAM
jgi:hypothetical protein